MPDQGAEDRLHEDRCRRDPGDVGVVAVSLLPMPPLRIPGAQGYLTLHPSYIVWVAIGVIDKSREYRIYIQDQRLSWPDALSFGPDGRLYTVSNQLHRSAPLHGGEQTATPPFYIFAFEPLAAGVSGR